MALVDFTNARIEPNSSSPLNPMEYIRLGINAVTENIVPRNSSGSAIGTGSSGSLSADSWYEKMYFQGTFTASGNEFYLGTSAASNVLWKVSNISFSSGDTYSFYIDMEIE